MSAHSTTCRILLACTSSDLLPRASAKSGRESRPVARRRSATRTRPLPLPLFNHRPPGRQTAQFRRAPSRAFVPSPLPAAQRHSGMSKYVATACARRIYVCVPWPRSAEGVAVASRRPRPCESLARDECLGGCGPLGYCLWRPRHSGVAARRPGLVAPYKFGPTGLSVRWRQRRHWLPCQWQSKARVTMSPGAASWPGRLCFEGLRGAGRHRVQCLLHSPLSSILTPQTQTHC